MLTALASALDRRGEPPLAVDRYLPEFDETQYRHVVVDADPETTYEAVLNADLSDTGPVVAALGWLRTLPERLRDGPAESAEPDALQAERLTFGDVTDVAGWVELAADPGTEFAMGAVGRFWRPVIEWRDVGADEFAAFDEPGYAKLVVGISLRPYGAGRTLVTYEARTAGTDADATRRFRRYWRLIGPFAGYLMGKALERIAADAAAAAAIAGGER